MFDVEKRTDELVRLSQDIYHHARRKDKEHGRERSQQVLRIGIQIVARTLEDSYGNGLLAGERLQSHVFDSLKAKKALDPWPSYKEHLAGLPRGRRLVSIDPDLDHIAKRYAMTMRKTMNLDGSFETDATHVVHMLGMSLPYAVTYYPDLDPAKVALYSLVHDLPEAYAKDTSSLGRSPEETASQHARESEAMRRIEKEIGGRYPKLIDAYWSYAEQSDDETKFTKSFDKLDPKFNSLYTFGRSLVGYHQLTSARYEELANQEFETMSATYGRDYHDLTRIQQELTRRVIGVTPWREID